MKKATIHKLFDHFYKNHIDEVLTAICEFFEISRMDAGEKLEFDNDYEEGLFMEWIAYDYRLKNGRKLIDDFIVENPLKLSKKALEVYEDLRINKYGMFEILKVERGEYVELVLKDPLYVNCLRRHYKQFKEFL